MVFLQPSTTESVFAFSTADGSDALVLDIKGIYAVIDGGSERLGFLDCLRTPAAAIVSSAAPSSLCNAVKMNEQSDSLVAVVGNLPSSAALKDAAAAEPLRELYKTLSVPPIVAQLKGAKPEAIVIHKGVSSGTLSVYTLAGDAKDAEAVAKAYQSGSAEAIETAAAAASSVLLVVWQPVREDAPIKRILHLGSAPLPRIQQALDRARSLPFLQSATASAAFLKGPKPAAAAAGSRPAARGGPASSAAASKPATGTRAAAPSSTRVTATRATASTVSTARSSLPSRPAAPTAKPASASAARPARASAAARPAAAAPAARSSAAARPAGAAREEVAKRTVVSKSGAAPSSSRPSARSTPTGSAAGTPSKSTKTATSAAAAVPAAVAAVAATTVVAASTLASSAVTPPISPIAASSAPVPPAISVSLEENEQHSTPGGLPVPASPTIIPATPQPPMSPEPMEHEPVAVHEMSPEPVSTEEEKENEKEKEEEKKDDQPIPPLTEDTPLPPLPHAPSVDEPECVKEIVEEEPEPDVPTPLPVPTPTPSPAEPEEPTKTDDENPYKPVEEPEPTPAAAPVDPAPVGDLLGDFDPAPQQPGDDGLLDSLEEPMKKMKISMDTDKLAEELGLTGGAAAPTTDESLLDLTDLDKTQNTSVIESAHEYDNTLSPIKKESGQFMEDLQRKLSQQAEESLLSTAAAPFIAGLASTVVEAATIDGAKSTLESIMNNSRGVESPTGDKLLSFRSSGYENPEDPKEVKYEETDPAIDDVLTKLADESDMVNGGRVELNGHGDSENNGHHHVELNGTGWPEGTTMHLPPPTGATNKGGPAKFKLAGPVHVDLVTVPHRGKIILLNDEVASLEFFSHVRSSLYIVQSGGEVPEHVMNGWMKGKGAWAANVASRLLPTHHNETIAKWTAAHTEELAELGLSVLTPIDLTTLTYPDGQAKACTLGL